MLGAFAAFSSPYWKQLLWGWIKWRGTNLKMTFGEAHRAGRNREEMRLDH